MGWWYNQIRGDVYQASGAQEVALKAAVFAQTHDPIPGQWLYGPYGSQADAEAVKAEHPAAVSIVPSPSDVTGAIGGAVGQLGQLALRVVEAAAGIVLMAVALNIILKQATGVDVAGAARRGAGRIYGAGRAAVTRGAA